MEHGCFTPLVISSSGGMRKVTSFVFEHTAVHLKELLLSHYELAMLLSKLFTIEVINNVYL